MPRFSDPSRRGIALARTVALAGTLSFAGAALPTGRIAFAAETATVREAQRLYNEGLDLRDAGDATRAAQRFEAAFALVPSPVIGLDLALEKVKLGALRGALAVLRVIARTPVLPAEKAKSSAARSDAARLASELEARIPLLRMLMGGRGESVVTLDGKTLFGEERTTPQQVDPGKHVIVATFPGRAPIRRELEIGERETKVVELGFGADTTPPHATPVGARLSTSPLTHVGFGFAAVGVVAGSITGILASSKVSTLKSDCAPSGLCPADREGDIDSARRMGTLSTISFAVAGAGVVVGVIGLLRSGGANGATEHADAAGPRVAPWVGLGSAGISGAF